MVFDSDGGCWTYPRRLRLYPDVREKAPAAWPQLRRSTRRTLDVRRALRGLTRGFVAPSLAAPVSEQRAPVPRDRASATRLVVVERSSEVHVLTEEERDADGATREAAEMLAAQRTRFSAAADERWARALRDAAEREAETLGAWLRPLPIARLRIPDAWQAPAAVAALAEWLGTRG